MSSKPAAVVCVREPHAVRHPESGAWVVPDPKQPHAADDPLVRAYPWMFGPADEVAAQRAAAAAGVESVPVETAVRRPGQKRDRVR